MNILLTNVDDRQDLHVNMLPMPDEELTVIVEREPGTGFADRALLKTGTCRMISPKIS